MIVIKRTFEFYKFSRAVLKNTLPIFGGTCAFDRLSDPFAQLLRYTAGAMLEVQ
jgi:hypothetical protein